ncbi:hypothetical protein M8C13_36240 [Crossiella sp. SN42]|uniref:hypothetical protein n=1 Tax=Crossiella sp. SN42 TaxID=2944808 RepID=UPI00207C813E|nr:hypothetical protein [Crossiella sp. SN42]MCO1581214.1 hypothetical protein [Crossiella sp. SN42]
MPKRHRPPLAAAGAWVGWHALELTALGLPLLAAAFITEWLALLAVPGALLWASQEIRAHRHRTRTADPAAEEGETA